MKPNAKAYRRSFIINTAIGGLMLLLAIVAQFFEAFFPALRWELVWGFVPGTLICWFIASLHYAKYAAMVSAERPRAAE